MLPTYNEAENIEPLIRELLALRDDMSVVVVDDNSPDGTWEIVNRMAQEEPRVTLVHRTTERGRGSAGTAGFKRAVELGADYIVEMDADFSHQPKFIPALLEAAQNADVVIGSRLVPGGGERGRNWIRTLITSVGNRYAQLVLGVPVRDCTSGFRVFSRQALETIGLDNLRANGPAIVQEMLAAAKARGLRFAETPIMFEERAAGESTFNMKILLRGMLNVWRYRFRKWNESTTKRN